MFGAAFVLDFLNISDRFYKKLKFTGLITKDVVFLVEP